MSREVCDSVKIVLEIDGEDHDVSFERTSEIETDSDYGADADGRRGVSVDFIESDKVSDVVIDGKNLEDYSEDFQKKANASIEEWLEDNEVNDDGPSFMDGPEHDDRD